MLGNGLANVLVDGQQCLAGSPVPSGELAVGLGRWDFQAWHAHFADELAAECVDDTGHRGLLALADEVKVKHALDGAGLQSAVHIMLERCPGAFCGCGVLLLDEASCLGVEEGVGGGWTQWPAGSYETTNVVVCRKTAISRCGWLLWG